MQDMCAGFHSQLAPLTVRKQLAPLTFGSQLAPLTVRKQLAPLTFGSQLFQTLN
jgi:hypothetical protein